MKKLERPFFLFNPKSYLWGSELLELAKYFDQLAEETGICAFMSAPYSDLPRIAQETEHLLITAQHMDSIQPGRGMGFVLPESLKEAGADAVVLNHAEHPLSTCELVKTHQRARALGFYTIVCADSVEEAQMIAVLQPDIMICEPTSLIGTGTVADDSYRQMTNKAVRTISPDTLILQASGISTGEDVYNAIAGGADGSGCTSGITTADDPKQVLHDMVYACVRIKKGV
uniref:triose-phosphate isomerase n=1 Tax=Ndongobacter massiliensis TaxID=1871025 RepID=UPI00093037DF|nr:triose-phosphate isomerase [Ndongobacter massiliensis]